MQTMCLRCFNKTMTPFEIILCVLIYLGIGVYFAFNCNAKSTGGRALSTLLWPLVIMIALFFWEEE